MQKSIKFHLTHYEIPQLSSQKLGATLETEPNILIVVSHALRLKSPLLMMWVPWKLFSMYLLKKP